MNIRILLLMLLLPANAYSAPKWITGAAKEVGRTAKDMILWKHPAWNLMALAEIGADFADATTTANCQHLPNCNEAHSFLYGRHPDYHKVLLIDLGSSWTLITMDHWLHTHRPEPYIKTSDYWWIAPGAADIISTSRAAYINSKVSLK